MSTTLEMLLKKLEDLSADELLILLEGLGKQLRHKTSGNGNGNGAKKAISLNEREATLAQYFLPRPTSEEVEARLAKMFTPDEIARIGKTDFKKRPVGSKPLSQTIIEDREDRF